MVNNHDGKRCEIKMSPVYLGVLVNVLKGESKK